MRRLCGPYAARIWWFMRSRDGTLRGQGALEKVNCAFRPLFMELQMDRDAKQPLAKKLKIPHMGGVICAPPYADHHTSVKEAWPFAWHWCHFMKNGDSILAVVI